jgi:hypothetical protein
MKTTTIFFKQILKTSLLFFTIAAMVFGVASAQPATPASGMGRQGCNITVNRSEPGQITNGEDRTLTITGTGFTEQTTIRLGQFGALSTTFVSPAVITGVLPANIPAGTYNVRLVDPECPNNDGINYPSTRPTLTVFNAPPPSQEPIPVDPPTETPGSPSLLARNFVASPPTVAPGGTVVLTVEIFNQGNRTAEAVSVSVNAEGSFLPVGGSVILPNIVPGTSVPVTLTATVAQSAEGGPTAIPITITYRDFTGETYESQASGSVTIEEVVQSTQLVLESYPYEPSPAIPGEPINVRVTVKNTGNTAASQALLTIAGDSSVLLAGPQGDTFSLFDLLPGQSSTVDLSLIVSPEAEPGPQSQSYTISFLLNGEAQDTTGRMTINVARVAPAAATMLLSHTVDKDPLQPGDRFQLSVELENVGQVAALGMLVTFGTVEQTGGDDDDNGSGGSSTTPSTTFAPLGTGGTQFIGDVDAGDTTTFEQMFIVNGTTTSGIYSLPITLRYQKPDGTSVQDNLRATVVVIKLPPLQVNLQAPPPEFVTVGEPIAVTYDLVNGGSTPIELTNATTEAENGEVVEGAETVIGQIPANDQGTYTAVVIPNEPGTVNFTVTIRYLDDLNNEREIVNTYTAEVAEPPPPMEEEQPTPDFMPVPTEEPEPDSDWIGQLLLGLLGLGS